MSLYKRQKRQEIEAPDKADQKNASGVLSNPSPDGKSQKLLPPPKSIPLAKKKKAIASSENTGANEVVPVSTSATGAFTLSFGTPSTPRPIEAKATSTSTGTDKPAKQPSSTSSHSSSHTGKTRKGYDNPYAKPQPFYPATIAETEVRTHGDTRIHVIGSAPIPQRSRDTANASSSTLEYSTISTESSKKPMNAYSMPPIPSQQSQHQHNRLDSASRSPHGGNASAGSHFAQNVQTSVKETLPLTFISPRLLESLCISESMYDATKEIVFGSSQSSDSGNNRETSAVTEMMTSSPSLPVAPTLKARPVIIPVNVAPHPFLRSLAAVSRVFVPVCATATEDSASLLQKMLMNASREHRDNVPVFCPRGKTNDFDDVCATLYDELVCDMPLADLIIVMNDTQTLPAGFERSHDIQKGKVVLGAHVTAVKVVDCGAIVEMSSKSKTRDDQLQNAQLDDIPVITLAQQENIVEFFHRYPQGVLMSLLNPAAVSLSLQHLLTYSSGLSPNQLVACTCWEHLEATLSAIVNKHSKASGVNKE